MNNPFDYVPSPECGEAYARLMERVGRLRRSSDEGDIRFLRELDAGKMLGVLVAADDGGRRHTLYAFSGQIADGGFHREGFVEPVFDYLAPDGYFKTHEAMISRQNDEIALFNAFEVWVARREYEDRRQSLFREVEAFRDECVRSKECRDARRRAGDVSEEEEKAMVLESQFQKAELRRMQKRAGEALRPHKEACENMERQLAAMKEKRKSDSEALQQWLFDNFKVLNARRESRSLSEIFAGTPFRVPPSGAGECCAPKLLQAAYTRGWKPLSMAEYWYGAPKGGEVRRHGGYYPACRGKCLPVLTWMLQGLDVEPPLHDHFVCHSHAAPEILFENEWFCVVSKPSGMLSVPGKGKAESVRDWLSSHYADGRSIRMAHRLDQHTSGLLIAAFGDGACRELQRLFATRRVRKTYVALLEGDWRETGLERKGRISLPLTPDWLDRPRQRVDFSDGKEALTDYEFVGVEDGLSRVLFHPLTGRTHQLRVHAASASGLGMPIVGDPLYGIRRTDSPFRLMLHALSVEFTFPLDGRRYSFTLPAPF